MITKKNLGKVMGKEFFAHFLFQNMDFNFYVFLFPNGIINVSPSGRHRE